MLAVFGLTLGIGVASYASIVYVQNFLIKFRFLDYDQTSSVVIFGLLLGNPFYVFFGWLSDRVGRKPLLMIGLLLAIIGFRPIYAQMYETTSLQSRSVDQKTSKQESQIAVLPTGDSLQTITSTTHYTDGTVHQEIKKINLSKDSTELIQSIKVNSKDLWTLIWMTTLLVIICSMCASPSTAFLVEMFPLKIRYTSFSLPYHISYGVFGGMAPVIATYLIEKANLGRDAHYYLAGLSYPILLMSISLLIGLLYLRENSSAAPKPLLNGVQRYLGIIWMLIALFSAYFGIVELGIPKLSSGKQEDLIFGVIVLFLITPVSSIGLFLFGRYAWLGKYSN